MTPRARSGGARGRSWTPWVVAGLVVALAAAVSSFSLTLANAASLPLADAPGAREDSGVEAIRNDVRDRFASGVTGPLQGQVADFHGGAAWAVDGGPMWNASTGGAPSTDWINYSSNYARRPAGSGPSTALVRWLTRSSTVSVQLRQLSSTTAGGVIMGADPSGSSGLVAVASRVGSNYRFGIFMLSGGSTLTPCSPLANLGGNSGSRWLIEMTHAPAAGGPATARLVRTNGGGGTFTVTSTCPTAAASGDRAGLVSVSPDSTRYDNFLAVL